VAIALGVTDRQLCYTLYGKRDRSRYRFFDIAKRGGGTRRISSPPPSLRWLQRQAYDLLQSQFIPKPCVHGFVPARSIVSNARLHTGRFAIVNFDIQDFFPTIHIGRVIGVFRNHPFEFGEEAARVLAQICCRDDGVLPQGGAMSPLISNLVCRSLDNDLLTFAREHRLRYSRYADDLTFSSNVSAFPVELINLDAAGTIQPGAEVANIVSSHQFAIHTAKVKLRTRDRRQEVTGLTVNQFPNVPRRFIRKLDGALYAWRTFGYEAAQARYETHFRHGSGIHLSNVIRGRLAFLKMVRGEHDFLYRRLVRLLR
jgi:RNA-directed DNA polymerase